MASTSELERKAEQVRQRLTEKLADLRYHVSPSTVMSDLLGIDAAAMGKELVPVITKQVRNNPLAFALIAAGVGWLIYSDVTARPGPAARTRATPKRRRKRSARGRSKVAPA